MIKRFYVLAWFLLIGSAMASVLQSTLNELGMVAFGLIALALVQGLALWSVIINTPGTQTG